MQARAGVGVGIGGIQGDVMLVTRSQNLYTGTLTLMQSSAAVTALLVLSAAGQSFPVKVEFNDYSFIGYAVIMNEGELAASRRGRAVEVHVKAPHWSAPLRSSPRSIWAARVRAMLACAVSLTVMSSSS